MKIRQDLFNVTSGGFHDDGTKAEAEEETTTRILTSDAPVTAGQEATGKSMPLQIVAYGTAGEIAANFNRLCSNCKYCDKTAWLKIVHDAEGQQGTPESRHAINEVRGALLMTQNAKVLETGLTEDNDFDVESVLKSLGLCHALTEHYREFVIVHSQSSCPLEVVTPTQPQGFFHARDGEARRDGARNRDAILNAAQGKSI